MSAHYYYVEFHAAKLAAVALALGESLVGINFHEHCPEVQGLLVVRSPAGRKVAFEFHMGTLRAPNVLGDAAKGKGRARPETWTNLATATETQVLAFVRRVVGETDKGFAILDARRVMSARAKLTEQAGARTMAEALGVASGDFVALEIAGQKSEGNYYNREPLRAAHAMTLKFEIKASDAEAFFGALRAAGLLQVTRLVPVENEETGDTSYVAAPGSGERVAS